jgi:hypothetical protein
VPMRNAARPLGFSYTYFSTQYRGWGLPGMKIGRKVLFAERDLDAFIDRRRQVIKPR